MATAFEQGNWALILGGSSGFGLATARKLAEQGLNLCIVHRDRRGAMRQIEPEFEKLKGLGIGFRSWNIDATSEEKRAGVLDELPDVIGEVGRVRVLLHSIAFGNLKLIAPEKTEPRSAPQALAKKLGIEPDAMIAAADELLAVGEDGLHPLVTPPT